MKNIKIQKQSLQEVSEILIVEFEKVKRRLVNKAFEIQSLEKTIRNLKVQKAKTSQILFEINKAFDSKNVKAMKKHVEELIKISFNTSTLESIKRDIKSNQQELGQLASDQRKLKIKRNCLSEIIVNLAKQIGSLES